MGTSMSGMTSPAVVLQARSTHTATIIFCHGLGDTGNGWADAFRHMDIPHMKVICPNAPSIPVSVNGHMQMPAWFDIFGLKDDAEEDDRGIIAASKTVHDIIEEEVKLGIPTNRIIIGGFSQGGALALYSALTCKKNLGGIVALSSWLPLRNSFPAAMQGNKDTAVFQCHGEQDILVAYAYGSKSSDFLKNMMTNVTFKKFPNLGHSSSPEFVFVIKYFLKFIDAVFAYCNSTSYYQAKKWSILNVNTGKVEILCE
ncbi:Acyl-protein thioesterase 2 [Nymphon striatum]|nr:Acyl-protein thioesterase 2 [Nymphon striatum]